MYTSRSFLKLPWHSRTSGRISFQHYIPLWIAISLPREDESSRSRLTSGEILSLRIALNFQSTWLSERSLHWVHDRDGTILYVHQHMFVCFLFTDSGVLSLKCKRCHCLECCWVCLIHAYGRVTRRKRKLELHIDTLNGERRSRRSSLRNVHCSVFKLCFNDIPYQDNSGKVKQRYVYIKKCGRIISTLRTSTSVAV